MIITQRQRQATARLIGRCCLFLALISVKNLPCALAATPSDQSSLRAKIVSEASDLLDQALVSYVYGGYQVGDSDDCRQCNDCLGAQTPTPPRRLIECPACSRCSLDCTHFIARVYDAAGAHYPYIDTKTMLQLSASALQHRYGLVDLGTDLPATLPGDILVYDGHAVLLERRHAPVEGQALFRGDIVHATGGRAIRTPGEGVQRERFVDLATFRGPLRRILRHSRLAGHASTDLPPIAAATTAPSKSIKTLAPKAHTDDAAARPERKLRRVEKRPSKAD